MIISDGGQLTYQIDFNYDLADEIQCLQRETELIGFHKRLNEGGYRTNVAGGIGSAAGAATVSLQRHAATLLMRRQ
jgi:hypothetical protein